MHPPAHPLTRQPLRLCGGLLQSAVSVDSVLDLGAFDLQRTLEMDDGFLDTDAEHQHDASVTSVAFSEPGELDLTALDEWISTTLRERGVDIFRMKGILALQGAPNKYVYQGVHMIFNGAFGDAWAEGEEKCSKLVFIGKNLDPEALRAEFKACVASPELDARKLAALRFQIGDEVQCMVDASSATWKRGKVVARMHREAGLVGAAPYQVELDDGRLVVAPLDKSNCVRIPLRFDIGDVVECNLGGSDGWQKGTIIAQTYRDASWPADKEVPYQVELLESGDRIWAPADDDSCIRRSS
jgi:hypothetical protein